MWSQAVLRESWQILGDSAPYILLGFLFAALLHVWLSGGRMAAMLQRAETRSVWMATLIGAPIPLCSCGVLPAAMSLRRQGASRGAALSFLISVPETNVDTMLLTYGLLGWPMAILRPIAGGATAIVAGLIENFFERRRPASESVAGETAVAADAMAGGTVAGASHDPAHARDPAGHVADCCPPSASPAVEDGSGGRFVHGFQHAFRDLFDDIIGWVLLSVLISGAIKVLIPDATLLSWLGNPWIAIGVMILIGVPLYVCAEASTPIAATLILKGVSPGAALAFLLAGPATNLGSIFVIARELGRRTCVVYLASIVVIAYLAGAAVHLLDQRFGLISAHAGRTGALPEAIRVGSSLLLLALAIPSFFRQRLPERLLLAFNRASPITLSPRGGGWAVGLGAIAIYVLTGFATVQPDEVGVVTRFGRVAAAQAGPGLHWTWPWPIGRMERVAVGSDERVLLGEGPAPASPADGNSAKQSTLDELTGWVWLGDENVASLKYALHWDVRPDRVAAFAFGIADVRRLLRSAGQTALREILSTSTIDTIYTTGRAEAERRAVERLQTFCDRTNCGVRVRAVRFLEVHAPVDVHAAFRDVASAVEERNTFILRAQGEEARTLPKARGDAEVRRTDGRIRSTELLARARGEAEAFSGRLKAASHYMPVTRTRMYYEALDAILPRLRAYVRTDDPRGRAIEFWFRTEKTTRGSMPPEPQ